MLLPLNYNVIVATFTGYMLVHLVTLQCLVTLLSLLCPGRLSAVLLSSLAVLALSLVSGLPVHRWDLPAPLEPYLGIASSARWLLPTLASREYSQDTLIASTAQYICKKSQVRVPH